MNSAILRAFGRASQAVPWNSEESIREELFSVERLEQHAESLAAAQRVTARPIAGRSLAVRLKDNESALLEAYLAIAGAVGEGRAVTPAAGPRRAASSSRARSRCRTSGTASWTKASSRRGSRRSTGRSS